MTWGWSHTAEAYDNAYKNLQDLPHEELCIILAEWDATTIEEYGATYFHPQVYERKLKQYQTDPVMTTDILADAIWEKASEQRICDNGGRNAWVCPEGCHAVPFDRNCQGDDDES
jgi:hypothetical protein